MEVLKRGARVFGETEEKVRPLSLSTMYCPTLPTKSPF